MTQRGPRRQPALIEGGWALTGDDGGGRAWRFVLGETELARAYLGLVFGRHPDLADRVLDDAAVSRRHCRFALAAGGLYVEDLHSLNGTALGDAWLPPFVPTPLAPGNVLTLGRVVLVVARLDAPEDVAMPAGRRG